MVPCMVTKDKYKFGSNTPSIIGVPMTLPFASNVGFQSTPNHSNIAKGSPGLDSCKRNKIDINMPTIPINIPVIRNCLAIIL